MFILTFLWGGGDKQLLHPMSCILSIKRGNCVSNQTAHFLMQCLHYYIHNICLNKQLSKSQVQSSVLDNTNRLHICLFRSFHSPNVLINLCYWNVCNLYSFRVYHSLFGLRMPLPPALLARLAKRGIVKPSEQGNIIKRIIHVSISSISCHLLPITFLS